MGFLATPGILVFAVVGLFQPGLTRFLTIKGIDTIGVAITDPIRGTTPLFTAFLAILLLGERMTLPIFLATLLIIAGVILVSHRGGSIQRIRVLYILYPLTASVLAGFSQVLRKFALGVVPHPLLGAAVTVSCSLVVTLLTIRLSGKGRGALVLGKECLSFFLAAGLSVSVAMIFIYYALYLGKVTVVIPISSTGPLFALTLSALFLRDVERVTLKIIMGALLIIFGVLVITMWK
jgi:drug/metabolite transporter (DMT)-like permease